MKKKYSMAMTTLCVPDSLVWRHSWAWWMASFQSTDTWFKMFKLSIGRCRAREIYRDGFLELRAKTSSRFFSRIRWVASKIHAESVTSKIFGPKTQVVRCRILTKDAEHSAPQRHNNWWSLHCEVSDFLHHLEMRSVLVRKSDTFKDWEDLDVVFSLKLFKSKERKFKSKNEESKTLWKTHKNWDSWPPELQLLWPACLDKSSAADNFVDSSTRLDCILHFTVFHHSLFSFIIFNILKYFHSVHCPQTLLRGERKGDGKPECKGCWGTCGDACFEGSPGTFACLRPVLLKHRWFLFLFSLNESEGDIRSLRLWICKFSLDEVSYNLSPR